MPTNSNFRLLEAADFEGIRKLFTERWDNSQCEIFSRSVIDYLGLTHEDMAGCEKLVLYAARGDRGKGFEEDLLGELRALVPGVVVFQAFNEWDWPISGLLYLENGLPRFWSGHEKGGINLVPLRQVSCSPDDLNDGWQALCLWSGFGHASTGGVYVIRPERWQYIATWLQRWLTP